MRAFIITIAVIAIGLTAMGQDTTFIAVFGGQDVEEAVTVFDLPNGNALTISNTGSYGAGNSDVYFAEISIQAQLVSSWTWGGSEQERALGNLLIDTALLVTWGIRNTFDDTEYRYFVAAHTLDGAFQWMYDPGIAYTDNFIDLIATENSIIIVYGQGQDIKSKHLSFTGDQLSNHSIDLNIDFNTGPCLFWDDTIYCALEIPNDSGSDYLMVRLDTTLTYLDSFLIDSALYETPVALSADSLGNIYVLGNKKDSSHLEEDGFILKTNSSLDILWMAYYTGPNLDLISSSLYSSGHQICFLGYTESYGEGGDFIFGRYDTLGQFFSAPTLGSSDIDVGVSAAESKISGYWLFGHTSGFNSSLNNLLLYKTNDQGITNSNDYVIIEDSINQSLTTKHIGKPGDLLIYPNPMDKSVFIKSENPVKTIKLIDCFGREVWRDVLPSAKHFLEYTVKDIPNAGIYYLQVSFQSGMVTKKLIVY